MIKASSLISSIGPRYSGHRDAEQRRRETREWLARRERELGFVTDAPPVAPDEVEAGTPTLSPH